jgi:hypothetical protein
MKQLIQCAVVAVLYLSCPSRGLSQQNNLFADAYVSCPSLPKGILEAVAFCNTRMNGLPNNAESCSGMPIPFGIMGLFDDGNGYFNENAKMVAKKSGITIEEQKNDNQNQVLAYAKALELTINAIKSENIKKRDVMALYEALKIFSEIPDYGTVNAFAKDVQIYGYLKFMSNAEKAIEFGFSLYPIDFEEVFGENNASILESDFIKIGSNAVSNADNITYIKPSHKSIDFAPAFWNPAATCNFSSRNGTNISAVTIHTIQGTYAGAISWAQNCNASVSYHYVVRSSDGQITQMVDETDKAWHVGSENPYTIGIEHEGYVSDPSWYSDPMYEQSAALCRDIITSGYGILGLRTYFGASSAQIQTLGGCIKIKGHQHYPNQTHTDPGINWNWEKYYQLINNQPTVINVISASGTLYDSGGANGNYSDDERKLWLIQPTNAGTITLNFTQFALEPAYDFLYIYDGNSLQSPLIGIFSGNQNPGSIASTSGALLLEFRSDCGTAAAGWAVNYTSQTIDNNGPTTQILTNPATWIKENQNISFSDIDAENNLLYRFGLFADHPANLSSWHGNGQQGYTLETFEEVSNWTLQSAGFANTSGKLQYTLATNENSNAFLEVTQSNQSVFLYEWDMQFISSGLNQRAGLHFFCSDPTLPNRGNSYFVYFREGQNKVEIYTVINDVYTLQHFETVTIQQNVSYHCSVIFDPQTGWIRAFINQELVASWKDPAPLTTGNSISFRSGGCVVAFDNLKCYKSRSALMPMTLQSDLRYLSTNAISTGKVEAISIDNQWNWSMPVSATYKLDWTPPVILDIADGLIQDIDTFHTDLLSANWQSMDPESGIANYEVALGNTSGSTNILTWTSVSLDTVFEYLLSSPAINDWYYLSLRVTNVAQHVVNQSSDGQQFGGYIANIGDLEIPEMKIVPNPVVNGFVVDGLTQETNYRLYASNGQMVLNGISYPNELIDVQSLSNGTYHLELYDDKKLIHAFVKLVLER